MRGQLNQEQRYKQTISRLKNENAKLRARVIELERRDVEKDLIIEDLRLQLEKLTEIVFGLTNKKKKDRGSDDINNDNNKISGSRKERNKDSYRRPVPSEDEVTKEEEYNIDLCPDCGTKLTKKEIAIRYLEDVIIPLLEKLKNTNSVTKQKITKGFCPVCKKWHSAIPINSQISSLGPKVKMFIAYAIYVLRLSYEQLTNILNDLYQLKISDGEIAQILSKIADKLHPEYLRLEQRIKESKSINADETGWQTGPEKNYAWVFASGQTEEAIFKIGQSRGKGHVSAFIEKYDGVLVTDFYPAYKNIECQHQGCWAHIIRKPKDLISSDSLSEDKKSFIKIIYEDVCQLYAEVREAVKTTFDLTSRQGLLPKMQEKLDMIINKILNYQEAPKKLLNFGKLLRDYKKELFTCILKDGVSPDNNNAERRLRHIVLKRKTSFGTKTDKGSDIFSINVSVLLSLWWKDKSQFFSNFCGLVGG